MQGLRVIVTLSGFQSVRRKYSVSPESEHCEESIGRRAL